MSDQDRDRWNKKWASIDGASWKPHPLLVEHAKYLSGGLALDLACGRGQNTIWLAQQGYLAWGVDISPVALRLARTEADVQGVSGRTRFMEADFDKWSLVRVMFDLVCVFRFLDRALFEQIRAGVRPGGLIFYSTRHTGALAHHPGSNQAYLLRPGELAATFSDWQILFHEEGPQDAALIARKTLSG